MFCFKETIKSISQSGTENVCIRIALSRILLVCVAKRVISNFIIEFGATHPQTMMTLIIFALVSTQLEWTIPCDNKSFKLNIFHKCVPFPSYVDFMCLHFRWHFQTEIGKQSTQRDVNENSIENNDKWMRRKNKKNGKQTKWRADAICDERNANVYDRHTDWRKLTEFRMSGLACEFVCVPTRHHQRKTEIKLGGWCGMCVWRRAVVEGQH